MADKTPVNLDRAQVKKAVQALQAYLKTQTTGDSLFPDETHPISLLFTLWKIPRKAQTIRIPLPHGRRTDAEICLFTKDEPRMTSDQTQRFYKKLLEEKGIKNITEVIPYKVLKTEYKPFEAKRRLLGNFSLFLSDDRVRRLLPSHLGKNFYQSKKTPLSVNLQSKNLARDIQRIIQGTTLTVGNKGCCCMTQVAFSGMSADEVTENIESAVQTAVDKLQMKGPIMKTIHLKSQSSVALPIYTSDLGHLSRKPPQNENAADKKKKTNKSEKKKEDTAAGEEEEIPQLVPIETPPKKPKLEKPAKKRQLQKPAAAKNRTKAPGKPTRRAAKMETKGKRKGANVK